MRLLITAEFCDRQAFRDVIVDFDDATTIGDLSRALVGRETSATSSAAGLSSNTPRPDNVIDIRRGAVLTVDTDIAPLFVGEEVLDSTKKIIATPVRQGVTVGVGGPSTHKASEPAGVAEIRVTSGRGAGRVYRLPVGTATIGSSAACTIRIDDPVLPDVAARAEVSSDGSVTLSADPSVRDGAIEHPHRREPATEPIVLAASTMEEIRRGRIARLFRRKPKRKGMQVGQRIDPADPLPLIRLERVDLDQIADPGPIAWQSGQILGVGNVLLENVAASAPDASLSPAQARPELDYNRPPRLHPAEEPSEFSLPSEPRKPDKPPIPIIMMLSPMLMSGSMYFMTRSPYSLLIMLLMPLMMLANATSSRRHQHKRYLKQMEEYDQKHVSVEHAALNSLVNERSLRRSVMPDPAALLLFATGPRSRLWERRRWDADFLTIRVGTADLPAGIVVKDPSREAHEGPLRWTSPDVPVHVPIAAAGVIGLAGSPDYCRQLASWMIAQIAGLHSPADAQLWVLTESSGEQAWDWAKWLPHVRGDEGQRPVRIGFDDDTRSSITGELGNITASRRELSEAEIAGVQRLIVVLDGARDLRMIPGMISLLKDGPRLGILFVCIDRTVHELPEECRSVIEVGDEYLNLKTTAERHIDGIRPDFVDPAWLSRLARAMAPIRDVSTEDLSAALPSASRLLDVLNLPEPTGEALARIWERGGRTTVATIGEGLDGDFAIDIRADGPHGLIAGTTGSGKSELLQTIIASLAVGNRPDEFTFILIDYKGGAAFMDCQYLPHTVGMVTDLDGHLTSRALESLVAELHYREHQLADAQAKDIEDYLAGRKPGDEPMPRLLIIIDEFAALVAELPDFVSGLVDVARRGRSLGVHLILATQRPAGVVNAEIKSNTNLRIALRVTDKGDSDDVIESGAAAEIAKSTPGRAYARLGATSIQPFQSSRVGGRPKGDTAAEEAAVSSFAWDDLAEAGRAAPAASGEDDVEIPTDLATLVKAISEASELCGFGEMRKPWLPTLPESFDLGSLDLAEPVEGTVPPVVLGRADLPYAQQQRTESWEIERGSHLMIAGQARSGRSSALRVVAASIAKQCSPADVHVFGVDAGNNALLPLVALPHVGAVVTRLQVDRVIRLFDYLQREVSRRQQVLAEQGYADVREQRNAVAPDERLPYLVVLLDRLEGFNATFESVDGGVLLERLTSLLQEGAGAGLRIVIAADRSGVLGRISMLVDDRIILSMSDPGDFSAVGLTARQVPNVMPPGRAFRSGERALEMQWAQLDASGVGTEQVRVLQDIGREASERWADVAKARLPQRIDDLPSAITLAEAQQLDRCSSSPSFTAVGVGGDTLELHGFDLVESGPGFLVAGPPRSGRSNALQVIIAAQPRNRSIVAIAPRVSPLRDMKRTQLFTGAEPIEEIKEAVSAAERRGVTIVVDDFELLGPDSPVGGFLAETFAGMRDSSNLIVVAGGVDELGGFYRGITADLKRGRAGLILSPRASSDGEILNARLPRSASGAMPQGRGILTSPTGWRWVQVPKVT